MNGNWSQWSLWQPCNVTCGGGKRTRFRSCSNPAPKWDGLDCSGTNISTENCNLHICKGGSLKVKTSSLYAIKTFLSWIVSSNNQWMTAGATGRHGNHAVWHVEGETEDVLAHAPIQRQSGTDRIALGQISPQRAAIYKNVEVLDAFSWKYFLRAELVFFLLFIYFIHLFKIFYDCTSVSMTSYLPGFSFTHDGKGVHEGVNEWQFRKINGMVETSSREMSGINQSLSYAGYWFIRWHLYWMMFISILLTEIFGWNRSHEKHKHSIQSEISCQNESVSFRLLFSGK